MGVFLNVQDCNDQIRGFLSIPILHSHPSHTQTTNHHKEQKQMDAIVTLTTSPRNIRRLPGGTKKIRKISQSQKKPSIRLVP